MISSQLTRFLERKVSYFFLRFKVDSTSYDFQNDYHHCLVDSMEFHNLRAGQNEAENRVASIRGRSRSEAIHFQTWPAGTGRVLLVVDSLPVPARLLGST